MIMERMDDSMKIVRLEGSPNRQGSSNMLAEEFAKEKVYTSSGHMRKERTGE